MAPDAGAGVPRAVTFEDVFWSMSGWVVAVAVTAYVFRPPVSIPVVFTPFVLWLVPSRVLITILNWTVKMLVLVVVGGYTVLCSGFVVETFIGRPFTSEVPAKLFRRFSKDPIHAVVVLSFIVYFCSFVFVMIRFKVWRAKTPL